MIRTGCTRFAALAAATLGLAGAFAPRAAAQDPSASAGTTAQPGSAGADDAFLDPDARTLHARARARWHEVDAALVRYQAVVSERVAASLRMPLRDRTLYASERSARIIWERNGGVAVADETGQIIVQVCHATPGQPTRPGTERFLSARAWQPGSSCLAKDQAY